MKININCLIKKMVILSISALFMMSCEDDISSLQTSVSFDAKKGVGQETEGGVVFHIDTLERKAYVVSKQDVGTFTPGCWEVSIDGAEGIATGTGKQNTLDIVSACSETNIAAKACADYDCGDYDDWFLPSKDELNQIYRNKSTLEHTKGFVALATTFYWSSTQINSSNVKLSWLQNFDNGDQHTTSRFYYNINHVRAVRVFDY